MPQVVSHYRIIKRIGEGGMGEVYLAEDTELGRRVALKFLSQERISSEHDLKRFIHEAQATAKLDHPNICAIYEVGRENDLSFIVMQYIEGETLAAKLQNNALGLEEIIDIAAQVADALAEAHSKGIIHRDIKPQNIMITARGQVKVLDFGLAKMVEDSQLGDNQQLTRSQLTAPGAIIGTPAYLSPEQAKGEALDARTDIFSLGVILYEMLSGRHPFKAESLASTLSMILTCDPPPLARFFPEFPGELQRVVSKALSKDPERRYQSVKDLQIDLKNLRDDLVFEAKLKRSKSHDAQPTPKTTTVFLATDGGKKELTSQHGKTTIIMQDTRLIPADDKTHRRAWIATLLVLTIAVVAVSYSLCVKTGDSVAVLPFVFTSTDAKILDDPDSEYLSDGITESVINSLSQIPKLKVIARSSVFRFKGKEADPQQVGRELGVRTVLMGRIIQRGDNLTIRTELSDVRDNRQIWGKQYDRKVSDLLSLQKEIATDIIDNLRLKLTGDDHSRLDKSYTDNAQAYELYLKGRYHWNKRNQEGFKKAIDFFQQAIEKDSRYALAYSGLADSYMLLSDWGFLPPAEGYSRARDAVMQALSIDDRLAEAHTSLAGIKAVVDWDWAGAENEYRRAIELNPNYPTAHQWYATHLIMMGRVDQSLAEIKRAQQLDPLSLGINKDYAIILLYARRYDDALEQSRKTLEIDPNFIVMHTYVAQAYELKQMYAEAVAEMQKAYAGSPDNAEIAYGLALAYAAAGMRSEARKIQDELSQPSKQIQYLPKEMALLYAELGERDKAFQILQKAFEDRYYSISELKMDPRFDDLRRDPRFPDLLRRLGLL